MSKKYFEDLFQIESSNSIFRISDSTTNLIVKKTFTNKYNFEIITNFGLLQVKTDDNIIVSDSLFEIQLNISNNLNNTFKTNKIYQEILKPNKTFEYKYNNKVGYLKLLKTEFFINKDLYDFEIIFIKISKKDFQKSKRKEKLKNICQEKNYQKKKRKKN